MFSDLELIAFELHQSKVLPSQNDIESLRRISLILDYYLPPYENFMVIGDFNLPVEPYRAKQPYRSHYTGLRYEQSYQKTNLLSISYSKLYRFDIG